MQTNAAHLLTRTLASFGIRVIAGIPGHTTFSFADAILDEKRITPITLRHEGVGAFAADAYFRVSGDMMALFTHTLAGTSNALAGVGNAYADSSAMVLIAGEEARESLGRGAYQELSRSMDGDVAQLVRHLTKRSWVCHSPLQIVEQAIRAVNTAKSGRPGPVSMHVYSDVWDQPVDIPDWPSTDAFRSDDVLPRPDANSVDRAAGLLRNASAPLVIAGNGVNIARAHAELLAFAEALDIPVATTVTGKGAFPEDHRLSVGVVGWVGTAVANWAARRADVIFSIGSRMTESTTSSWQPGGTFDPRRAALIQSDIDYSQIGNFFPIGAGLIGDAKHVLTDLAAAAAGLYAPAAWLSGIAEQKTSWAAVCAEATRRETVPLAVGPVLAELRRASTGTPLNIVSDVGKHHKWLAQQFEARQGDIVISSMGAATMGIGPCGALGAALGRPGAKTVAWVGDGGMTMSLAALPTVAEYNLPVLFIVIDDNSYGAVVQAQRKRYGRSGYAEFNAGGANPGYALDLARVADACGIPSRRVERPEDVGQAVKSGLESSGPVVLDVVVDRDSVIPDGHGFKHMDIWNHPVFPWVAS